MKKKILLVLFLMLLTGCVRTDINNGDYKELVSQVINNKTNGTNEVANGYRFYVPKGVRLIENDSNNQIFMSMGTKIYMYVDITSYYYKNSLNYKDIEDGYYSSKVSSGDKTGFIKITKTDDDKFYVEIVYNYAKVEVYTNQYNLNDIITLSSILLNNISYNDNIIENLLDDNHNSGSDITYNIDKPEDASSDFTQYLNEYITEEEADTGSEKLPDE
jgi:hypothetical protein